MKITKNIYVETVEILVLGASRWRKVGLEGELEEGEDVVAASRELKKKVDEIQKLNNVDVDTFAPPIPKEKIDPRKERMKLLIDSATTKAQLVNYRFDCPKELSDYLEDKLKKIKK